MKKVILLVIAIFQISVFSVALNAQVLENRLELVGDNVGFAPPPPSPLRIERFQFATWSENPEPETTITLFWDDLRHATGYKIFRLRTQLTQAVANNGFMAFSLPQFETDQIQGNNWTLIGTRLGADNYFTDSDIPSVALSLPPSQRRSLGVMYCYRIESTGIRGMAQPICTRIRGLNAPAISENFEASATSIRINWTRESQLEAIGYKIRVEEYEEGDHVQTVVVNDPGANSLDIRDLKPDTEYTFFVRAFDFFGDSARGGRRFKTNALPAPGPELHSIQLNLQRVDVASPNMLVYIPYEATLPIVGFIPNGKLTSVESLSAWPTLFFIKPNHNSLECDDANAVVQLNPGDTMTSSQMVEVFGSNEPDLPLYFLACAGATSQILNWIPIKVSYEVE